MSVRDVFPTSSKCCHLGKTTENTFAPNLHVLCAWEVTRVHDSAQLTAPEKQFSTFPSNAGFIYFATTGIEFTI